MLLATVLTGVESGNLTWLWRVPLCCRAILFLCTIALYIVLAVGVAHMSERDLGDRLIPWPDWCWFVALGASFFWGLLGLFSLRGKTFAKESRMVEIVKSRYRAVLVFP